MIALYPQRRDLVPHETPAPGKTAAPAPKAQPITPHPDPLPQAGAQDKRE